MQLLKFWALDYELHCRAKIVKSAADSLHRCLAHLVGVRKDELERRRGEDGIASFRLQACHLRPQHKVREFRKGGVGDVGQPFPVVVFGLNEKPDVPDEFVRQPQLFGVNRRLAAQLRLASDHEPSVLPHFCAQHV